MAARRITQIAAYNAHSLAALAEDGTLWQLVSGSEWRALPSLPTRAEMFAQRTAALDEGEDDGVGVPPHECLSAHCDCCDEDLEPPVACTTHRWVATPDGVLCGTCRELHPATAALIASVDAEMRAAELMGRAMDACRSPVAEDAA